jgi:TonB family protein
MRGNGFFGFAMLLAISVAQPGMLFCQEKSADSNEPDSYQGEPICPNAHQRGVYPHPTYQPEPEYDNKSRKKKTHGLVILSTIVTKEGTTADIKVVKSLSPELDKQAIKAVTRWKFEPATYEGKPCPMVVSVEVQFKLY